jgi:hypothetical protein
LRLHHQDAGDPWCAAALNNPHNAGEVSARRGARRRAEDDEGGSLIA